MRACAIILGALTAACAAEREPLIVREPVEVLVETTVPCPVDVPATEGPDFAAADSNIEYAAIYAEGRIIALRSEVEELRSQIEACDD